MKSDHLTEDQLSRYFRGEGDSDEGGVIEEHLLLCDPCALLAAHVEAAVALVENTLNQKEALKN